MNRKLIIRALLLLLVLCTAAPAYAAGAPTSQFYFKGWPYRQSTACRPTTAPENCEPTADPTAVPTAVPTAAPTAAPTLVPTLKPTAEPTAVPTAAPTVKPTAAPTAKPTAKPVQTPSAPDYTTDSLSAQEQTAWNLLNQDRQRNGLASLPIDPELSRLARLKSQDMRDNRYFSHTSPTYGSPSAMLKSFGYSFNSVGENIAHHATVEKSQAAFMSSTGHRQNILGSQWAKVGIGVAYDANGFVYVTQLFVR
ncbi:MAG: hypothetical protein IJ461_07465 [Clostridia bacterium]|nr:hypothetical protein [Clostridia bacterium]